MSPDMICFCRGIKYMPKIIKRMATFSKIKRKYSIIADEFILYELADDFLIRFCDRKVFGGAKKTDQKINEQNISMRNVYKEKKENLHNIEETNKNLNLFLAGKKMLWLPIGAAEFVENMNNSEFLEKASKQKINNLYEWRLFMVKNVDIRHPLLEELNDKEILCIKEEVFERYINFWFGEHNFSSSVIPICKKCGHLVAAYKRTEIVCPNCGDESGYESWRYGV